MAQGTQIIATVKGLDARENFVARVDGPAERHETLRLRSDPSGQAQVFLHGPRPGRHSISIEAGSGQAHVDFEVR